ncbi:MAG: aminotransferase class I/II-fold pyridoxal phosphate-dependent enzyme [Actinobacteria bacterium]|nr:aminotransferase class I/II-fold pyridoxal phosphate-dependent enzyme [Actinomycetota bacterium]NCA25356.1 aminotransferase class I/II-fold pyridoxal phosphate-dependent enzyme [Actinomycetota bacterium]NCU77969.1 aminotransferase class I/II-fold pyridoxal phosphate-dependent enzyme [Actinomycetota bacterium]NCU96155.1 aminotransferase class I/II-fold pyridoxal phosphate-dependent enzyme [Actinomycetota bacterium]NCZ76653.1 aminotransferase class I/II-fold pyridoxal phosphate-dependent enzym
MSQGHDWEKLSTETKVVAAGRPAKKPDGALNPSIALNSTFHEGGPVGYGRYGNEVWSALEESISLLEGGQSLIFSSGMGAISSVFSLMPEGAVIVAAENGYQGTTTMLKKMHEAKRLDVRFVNLPDTDSVLKALPGAQMLYLESPTNPAIEVVDLPVVIAAGKKAGCLVVVDNTLATPMIQNPLALGADISLHSVTKYLSGHSDILLGCTVTKNDTLNEKLEQARRYGGAIAGPFEAWIALRGLRTFALRMQRSQENAMELAKRLEKDPRVLKVRYPGLPSDPFHLRAKSFMRGFGAMISFEVKAEVAQIDKMCNSSNLITNATSLGGVESIWERRRRWATESHTIPENLIRFSVGIENVDDLWADIQASFSAANIK